MSDQATKVVHDHWDAYPVSTDHGPMFVLFDVEAAQQDLAAQFPYCARIIIPIQSPNEHGGPVGVEREHLDAIEDELCAALAEAQVSCRLVGRLTYRGERELVFQLADYAAFRPHVGRWMSEQTAYQLNVSEHDGWDFFRDCICPTREVWLWIADRNVIDNLTEAGSDPELPHDIEFVFTGAAAGLQQVASALTAQGYTPEHALNTASGSIVLSKSLPLDLGLLFQHSLEHLQLADHHHVIYDGWGASIVPPSS